MNSYNSLKISNPKRHFDSPEMVQSRLFPYYAGYSADFTDTLIQSLGVAKGSIILDPWNGSGTTMRSAMASGAHAVGVDLNPAMVIVAKAGLWSSLESTSLESLSRHIISLANTDEGINIEPLNTWFIGESAAFLRSIEIQINRLFISHDTYLSLETDENLKKVSPLAGLFYVALFRTTRHLLQHFVSSNPTWVKKPTSPYARVRPTKEHISTVFLGEIDKLRKALSQRKPLPIKPNNTAHLILGSSENLPIPNESIDFVISSPPYCTRIDYAVSTVIELAILRVTQSSFDGLRRALMGSSTVAEGKVEARLEWGKECLDFLSELYRHPSKASKTYYFKSHIQYFRSLYVSVGEVARVLRKGSTCVMVMQDSHYKEIKNDVPKILMEMAERKNLVVRRRDDFISDRSMVGMNKAAKQYLPNRKHTESVICMEKI